jgi:predicted alpha/beta hydrolase family esterase
MTKQILFIHGGGGGAYKADAALAESLRAELGADYHVRYPEMPNDAEPDYQTWKCIILDHAREMGERAILVGHSIGASVLLKIFTEPDDKPPIAGLISISAPFWHEDDFWRWDEVKLSADAAQNFPRDTPLFLYHGKADDFVPPEHLDMHAKALPFATIQELAGRDHQLNGDLSDVARDIAELV